MMNEAVVLAGGFGTRMKDLLGDLPKPMAQINGRPFLELVLDYLCLYNIDKIILSTGYLSEKIENHFGSSYKDASISYSVEKEPLGTGGAIKAALNGISGDNFLVLNGDTLFKADIDKLKIKHITKGADISIALREVENCNRYGAVSLDKNNRIVSFIEKSSEPSPGPINGGVYILNKEVFSQLILPQSFSIEKDLFALHTGDLNIFGNISNAYFIDIGTPDDYKRAEDEL
jgi:D-glycero-alpha-D-manno-heptose 1-phosphate guanylyltransferase